MIHQINYNGFESILITVNVDIFACIHFLEFTKIGIFAWIKIRLLRINGYLGYDKSNFHDKHIFPVI